MYVEFLSAQNAPSLQAQHKNSLTYPGRIFFFEKQKATKDLPTEMFVTSKSISFDNLQSVHSLVNDWFLNYV